MSTRDKRSSYAAIPLRSSFARASYALSQRETPVAKSSAPASMWDISAAPSLWFRELSNAVSKGGGGAAGGNGIEAFPVGGGGPVTVGSGRGTTVTTVARICQRKMEVC